MTDVTGAGDGPPAGGMTFQAFADLIGKSRPYISKLVGEGRIRPPALTADRKIIPDLAQRQIAESSDPLRPSAAARGDGDTPTVAAMKARRAAADAERAEIETRRAAAEERIRHGELLERAIVTATLGPLLRELRDQSLAVPREHVLDPAQAAACEEALRVVFLRASDRILTDADAGGRPAG